MDIHYLTFEQVLVIHQDQIQRYGGKELYASILDKAATLMHSLILNHPFVDGNKRTGIAATIVFLKLNNYSLKTDHDNLVNLALDIESKKMNLQEIIHWLRDNTK